MDLVPLHVGLVNHLLRGHAHRVDERGDALVCGLPGVLACEKDAGILSLEGNPCYLDRAALQFLADGGDGLIGRFLEGMGFLGK